MLAYVFSPHGKIAHTYTQSKTNKQINKQTKKQNKTKKG